MMSETGSAEQQNISERSAMNNPTFNSSKDQSSSNGAPNLGTSLLHSPNPMMDSCAMYAGIPFGQPYDASVSSQPRNFPNQPFSPFSKQSQSFRANNPNYNGTNTNYGLPSYGHTNYGQDCTNVNTTDKHEIDSALIAALRDPKERVAVLRLENELLKFMESANGWMEIAGSYNSVIWMGDPSPPLTSQQQQRQSSFQRCVLHRLSDRFGIVREQGQLQGALRLIKVAHSAVPALKLCDLQDEELGDAFVRLKVDGGPTPDLPSKMKIMKRESTPADSKPAATQAPKTATSASSRVEKEKAYDEARARIFRDSIGKGQSANAGAPKAVYRNREQEESDPDFRRGSFPVASRLQAAAPAFVPKTSPEGDDIEETTTTG